MFVSALATLKPQAAPGIVPAAASMPAGGAIPGGIPEPMEAAEPGPVGMTDEIIQKVITIIISTYFRVYSDFLT